RIVAVHGKGGDEDRAVDADRVHGRHHLVTGDVIGPIWDTVPGPVRGVRLIGVDLGIDDRHRDAPPCEAGFITCGRIGPEVRRIAGAVGRGNVKGAGASRITPDHANAFSSTTNRVSPVTPVVFS